jgi:hypothetical protein
MKLSSEVWFEENIMSNIDKAIIFMGANPITCIVILLIGLFILYLLGRIKRWWQERRVLKFHNSITRKFRF